MSKMCAKESLDGYVCAREILHGGACIAAAGEWWAQYDAGRKNANSALERDDEEVADMRGVWR